MKDKISKKWLRIGDGKIIKLKQKAITMGGETR
jgi:hypothetical protein